ncbi:transcriptional regulator [Photobacterium jeanii]|uniref:Transcriptional regulator n=1 Tax=Photobacterium jeanii TaxID=858640 RepID=A0A178KLB0_9GAMM|nr:ChrR family anti-sigma-E factor [Photobacterium jeanii]OAN18178.1 transcriptional regulator [Photobacterium jeanii]PST92145.1 transcriptional regulator [Photobacterium jeanii]
MIKHHPHATLLQDYVEGKLPLSLSIAVSAHIELCPHCQQQADTLTEQVAMRSWRESVTLTEPEVTEDFALQANFDAMFSDIVENEPVDEKPEPIITTSYVECKGTSYPLPRALRRFNELSWHGIGKITRARLPLEENEVRASLLHIDKQGAIPAHTHKGYELTLLLAGEFSDENGKYQAGDFIWLDASNHHTPSTKEGCLCYTVSNAPLHFTQGMSQLLNGIGNVIY